MKHNYLSILLILLSFNLRAQTSITGFVTDSLNKPITSASVYLSKTTIGTLTNEVGLYSLTIPQNGVYELISSCVGFKSKSIIVSIKGISQKINLRLSVNPVNLEEVTVKSKAKIRIKEPD